ncbi:hypothetical protein GCM10009831_07020 [Dietzia cercidiphylli]|uniref:Uncharacterized protein n=1 Tax=Dietzia cercidiphylli TaxID=498199 RepID=A0ABN2I9I1_9ACTN
MGADGSTLPKSRHAGRGIPDPSAPAILIPWGTCGILVELPGQGGELVWPPGPAIAGLVGRARPGRVSDHPPEKWEGDTPDRVDAS